MIATIDPQAVEQSDAVYDLADKIQPVLEADSAKAWTPSQMARKVKASTDETRAVLNWMVAHVYAAADGNGAWTRYSARQR